MRIVILTEGGGLRGFGHVARCLSLAEAFVEAGIRPELILDGDDIVVEFVRRCDCSVPIRRMAWPRLRHRLRDMISGADLVIVDSYQADAEVIADVSAQAGLAVFVDDNRGLDYPPGVIVNPSIYARVEDYRQRPGRHYLVGANYCMLRKCFWDLAPKSIRPVVQKILVAMGGSDVKCLAPAILSFLCDEYPGAAKYVIATPAYPGRADLSVGADNNTEVIYYAAEADLVALMLDADVAIAAGGQTLFELVRTGVPTVAVPVVEHQEDGVWALQRLRLVERVAFQTGEPLRAALSRALRRLEDPAERERRSRRGRELVDGQGSRRVVDFVLSLVQCNERGSAETS